MTKTIKGQPSKRAPPKKSELTTSTLILIDLVAIIFSLMPAVCAYSLTGLFIYYGYATTWLVLPLSPFVLFISFIATITLLRLCLPTLKAGRYKRELNRHVFFWYCHLALSRAAKITGLTPLLQSFSITKFLYWRALGAKVSFHITNSFDIDFVDSPLITIGKGVTIGSQTCISCHSDIGNYLYLAPVTIEDNVFIGMNNIIGPGSTIREGAWIGYGNALINQEIEKNTKLKSIRPNE